jgi:hypothetical protein
MRPSATGTTAAVGACAAGKHSPEAFGSGQQWKVEVPRPSVSEKRFDLTPRLPIEFYSIFDYVFQMRGDRLMRKTFTIVAVAAFGLFFPPRKPLRSITF